MVGRRSEQTAKLADHSSVVSAPTKVRLHESSIGCVLKLLLIYFLSFPANSYDLTFNHPPHEANQHSELPWPWPLTSVQSKCLHSRQYSHRRSQDFACGAPTTTSHTGKTSLIITHSSRSLYPSIPSTFTLTTQYFFIQL